MSNKDIEDDFAAITDWIPISEAKGIVDFLKAKGLYTREQIRKSSYAWVKVGDTSKGYTCQVRAKRGVHPEFELNG